MSRLTAVPAQYLPSGVLLREWTTSTEIKEFAVGSEAMWGSATVIAVAANECEFRFNHYWSASDVGWPKELSLAGSLHLEPNHVLRVRLWTTRSAQAMAGILCGVVALWFVWGLLSGLLGGGWGGFGKALGALCVAATIVAVSLSGAKRFGQDALRAAKSVAMSSRGHR